MSGFNQAIIAFESGGLTLNRKPLFLNNDAFSKLSNAYLWRGRVKKRDGTGAAGRLRRVLTGEALGNLTAGGLFVNQDMRSILIASTALSADETNSEIEPVTLVINDGTGTWTDVNGNGVLTGTLGRTGTINYATWIVDLQGGTAGAAITAGFAYYPSLPVMGIITRDSGTVAIETTVYFDTIYSYQFTGGDFQQLGTATWTGDTTNLFWGANYQGATPNLRYFFATNNNITEGLATPYDPIRYFDGSSWTDLQPALDSANYLYQARILIPYYGRLLALNTWEGAKSGGNFDPSIANNFYSRCRFSQIGDPTASDAWRSDQFGKGGFLDAPTNESIVSVAFHRNTLIVFFEYSTWQLRYIGEYGLPFIFERISSDFGCTATNSPIIFDDGVMSTSLRAFTKASAGGVQRIDDKIPNTAFSFKIQDDYMNFVHGVRDFQKEVVYWNYADASTLSTTQLFPNSVLLYNYENNTWAQFRDTITCFGSGQFQFGVTWDSLSTFWDDGDVLWESTDDHNYSTFILAGNQQGFITIYGSNEDATGISSPLAYAQSLAITEIDVTTNPTQFIVPNHNLVNGEFVYLTGAMWKDGDVDPGFNSKIYKVQLVTTAPADQYSTLVFLEWNGTEYNYVSTTEVSEYIGGGTLAPLPVMDIIGKDFNPFQQAGKAFKISFIDFQLDSATSAPYVAVAAVNLYLNSYLGASGNIGSYANTDIYFSPNESGFISGATKDNPCQITSTNHSLLTGAIIVINLVNGMTQLNGGVYTVTVVDANNFTLDGIDSTGYSTYTNGGVWNVLQTDGQQNAYGSEYAWYRFYASVFGQYLRIQLTYDDIAMNQKATHQLDFEWNGMNIWFREGGKLLM